MDLTASSVGQSLDELRASEFGEIYRTATLGDGSGRPDRRDNRLLADTHHTRRSGDDHGGGRGLAGGDRRAEVRTWVRRATLASRDSLLPRHDRGDLGNSIFTRHSVRELIFSRLEPTLSLAIFSEVLAIVIGIPLGITGGVEGEHLDRPRRDDLCRAGSGPAVVLAGL